MRWVGGGWCVCVLGGGGGGGGGGAVGGGGITDVSKYHDVGIWSIG